MLNQTAAEPVPAAERPPLADPALLAGRPADARSLKLAADTMRDLLRLGLAPIPRNYELWYMYLSGASPELTQKLDALQAEQTPVTDDLLASLHEQQFGDLSNALDTVGRASGEIEEATNTLLDVIADGEAPLRDYGASLATWSGRIKDAKNLAALANAVASLATETTRAAEDNRRLRDQLDQASKRIATLRQSLATVRQAATVDALTGLANRRAFDTRLRRAMNQSKRETFSLLMADIDHFKRFNDEHGHSTGDLVLRLVSRVLAQGVKTRDLVARYGGEEFAILLNAASLATAEKIAKRLCEDISSKALTNKSPGQDIGRITISVGVGEYQPGEKMSALIERVDTALYAAKAAGRDRVVVSNHVEPTR